MKQTVNPVHLLYLTNGYSSQIVWDPCVETQPEIIPLGCLEIRGGSFCPSPGTLSWCCGQSIRWSLVFPAPEIPLRCQLWYHDQSNQSVSYWSWAGSSSEFFEPVRKSKITTTKNIAKLRGYCDKSCTRSEHENKWRALGTGWQFLFPSHGPFIILLSSAGEMSKRKIILFMRLFPNSLWSEFLSLVIEQRDIYFKAQVI